MSITPEEIAHLAHLAKLKTDQETSAFYAVQLTRILALIEQMNQINTEDIEPMSHPQDMALRLREDIVTKTDHREAYQTIAPEAEAGLYLVPKVID